MKNRLLAAAAAMVMATSVLLTGAGAVPQAFASSYFGPCVGNDPSHPENNLHWFDIRQDGYQYDEAESLYTINGHAACTGGTNVGQSMVILATIEGVNGGTFNEAQCGYGDITGRGDVYFYTADNNGAWYDFNAGVRWNTGDQVRCRVWSTGDGHWDYQITNYTSGQTSPIRQSLRSGYGAYVWYGFEINDDYDQFGSRLETQTTDTIQYPAYMYSGSSLEHYLTKRTGDNGSTAKGTVRWWMGMGLSYNGTANYTNVWAQETTH